jgi:prephenate dehydrogenase
MMNGVNQISIMGMGLMGASLAAALKDSAYSGSVIGWARRDEVCEAAKRSGWFDSVTADASAAVAEADLVVFCLPVQAIGEMVLELASEFKPGAVVTDVGSTKLTLVEALTMRLAEGSVSFVGSHPICGSEKSGFKAADKHLYRDRLTVVCPGASDAATARISALWACVGSEVLEMGAQEHDGILASTSHLPHMVAALVVRAVAGERDAIDFCGTGFQDTTRVASGSSAVWADIMESNREILQERLVRFQDELSGLLMLLDSGSHAEMEAWLREAASQRNEMVKNSRYID